MALEVVKVKKCIKIGTIIGYCIMMLIIGIYIGSMHPKIGNTQKRGFDIFQSYSFASGDYKDTTIMVIVNDGDYDADTMFEEIKDFHNKLNGESGELTIRLYNSRNDCKSRNCIGNKTYYKE